MCQIELYFSDMFMTGCFGLFVTAALSFLTVYDPKIELDKADQED